VLARAETVHQWRPENLERPWRTEQTHQPNLGERHAVETEVDGQVIDRDAEGKPFGEIQHAHPEQLAPQIHPPHPQLGSLYTRRTAGESGSA
jgi:hypothetical protein